MNVPEAASEATDRGLGFQTIGFMIVGLGSVAILELASGSGFWWYNSFETATTRMYWSFVVPLVALFDWGRKMFESGKAIREAKKAQIRDEGVREGVQLGREQTIQQMKTLLEQNNVTLPPEIADEVFGDARNGRR